MAQEFGKVRGFLWPIHRSELSRLLPLFFLGFFICLNYYILRTAKDTLIVTAPKSGAEALPFIKVWAILPVAFLMTFIFTRFSNYLRKRNVFYAMMWFYIAYFVLFIFVLYPLRDQLHPDGLADRLQAALPAGFKGLIAMFRNWTYTSFYVMAEMWSTMIVTVLFWGFSNDVTSVKEAKRFYGLLAFGTALSGVLAGYISPFVSSLPFNPNLHFGKTGWDQSLLYLTIVIIVSALISMALYAWLNKRGHGYTEETETAHREAPTKMGIRKNFSYLAKSRYLTWIAILVVTYNIAINLAEIVWKDQIKQLYPEPADYNAYMGGVVFWLSTIASALSLFAGNLIRYFGWTRSALVAPVATLLTGVLFFACLLLPQSYLRDICLGFGTTPLALAAFFGSLQNCVLRGTKYSLVDATKEMSFIPLSPESRQRGKAAIDGVGSRLGKSGGSLIYQFLLMALGSITASIPVVALILFGAIVGWIAAARSLGRQFNQLTSEHQTLVVPEDEKPLLV